MTADNLDDDYHDDDYNNSDFVNIYHDEFNDDFDESMIDLFRLHGCICPQHDHAFTYLFVRPRLPWQAAIQPIIR